MNPQVQKELDFLKTVNPSNIHMVLQIKSGQRASFESLWYRHGPEAARLSLLPDFHRGNLKKKCATTTS